MNKCKQCKKELRKPAECGMCKDNPFLSSYFESKETVTSLPKKIQTTQDFIDNFTESPVDYPFTIKADKAILGSLVITNDYVTKVEIEPASIIVDTAEGDVIISEKNLQTIYKASKFYNNSTLDKDKLFRAFEATLKNCLIIHNDFYTPAEVRSTDAVFRLFLDNYEDQ